MAVMTVIKSAILNHSQKELLKDSILSYVTVLQKRYYKDKTIAEETYLEKMKDIQEIINALHLNELYKSWCDNFETGSAELTSAVFYCTIWVIKQTQWNSENFPPLNTTQFIPMILLVKLDSGI